MKNTEINKLLIKHRGDKAKFARFLGCPITTLDSQLKSDKPKDNLYGKYKEFLIEQKKQELVW